MVSRSIAAVLLIGVCNVSSGVAQTAATAPTSVPSPLPLGVSPELYQIAVPPNRVPAPDAAALGTRLFREKRLSADNTVSCDTCHYVDKGLHRPSAG
jgi:cytochrome c peroxidase